MHPLLSHLICVEILLIFAVTLYDYRLIVFIVFFDTVSYKTISCKCLVARLQCLMIVLLLHQREICKQFYAPCVLCACSCVSISLLCLIVSYQQRCGVCSSPSSVHTSEMCELILSMPTGVMSDGCSVVSYRACGSFNFQYVKCAYSAEFSSKQHL